MRKKFLIQQNLALFEQLQKAQLEANELKSRLEDYDKKIAELVAALESRKKAEATEPLKKLEEKIITNANIKPDVDYGAKVIGEIVVLATKHSNELTEGGDNTFRELVNLILGRTEVAKADILNIVSSEDGIAVKTAKIDAVKAETEEYFKSVMAQRI